MVSEYVGSYYGNADVACEMPTNFLSLLVDTYVMHLAGSNPQVLLPTARKDILPFVADLESIVNKELKEMNFDKTIRRWVLEAIFSIGILKCGLVDSDYVEVIPGQPQPSQDYFADIVDLDDFVFDTEASSWDRITFIGDRYKVDYDQLMESPSFSDEGKASLKVREDMFEEDGERVSDIGIDESADGDESSFKKTAWVWDICLPEEGLIVTIAENDQDSITAPLKVIEWDGVSNSPYHCLWFSDVPGNLMPLAPGQVVRSLNKSLNALYVKMVNQARRQKTLGLFRHGETDDAKRIQTADDGDLVPVSDPSTVNEVNFGGASQENLAFAIHARDLFSQLAGNLDAMGGLGPQSDTFRQDALISSTVSKKTAKMSLAVVDATTEVIRDFVYRIWTDPLKSYSATRPVSGTSVEVEAQLLPGERFGSFHDFDIRIEPYSMTYKSPQERSSDIVQLLMNVVFPIMPMLQQQGIGLNLQRVMEILSKYMSLPELQLMFEFISVPLPGTNDDGATQPQMTHRTYERISRPGASRQGNDQTMQQILMGGNPQESQVAALSRPTGA